MDEKFDLIMDILNHIPENLPAMTMFKSFPSSNGEDIYAVDICKEFNIVFLPQFVNIDTCIKDEGKRLRMQGYIKIDFDLLYASTVEELKLIQNIINNAYIEWHEFDEEPCLEIWNFSINKDGKEFPF